MMEVNPGFSLTLDQPQNEVLQPLPGLPLLPLGLSKEARDLTVLLLA